jgi:Fe-Mn family superoxide dismutase
VLVLDVCLADDIARRTDTIPGAIFRLRKTLSEWAGDIPKDKPVVVSCVYGFQVSREAVAELRRRGVDARPLSGGIAAWHAIGGATIPLAQP